MGFIIIYFEILFDYLEKIFTYYPKKKVWIAYEGKFCYLGIFRKDYVGKKKHFFLSFG